MFSFSRCPIPSQCFNTPGSYYCVCDPGWEKVSEFQCVDINECSRGIHGCDPQSSCVNSPGSWKCICNKGWYPDPKDARLPTCKDVNECVDVPNSCPVQSKCVNTEGSYHCSCLSGWRNQGLHACIDINECSLGYYRCPSNSHCVNIQGSYECHCNPGFRPRVTTSRCYDVNECVTGDYSCSSHAYCVNTFGSYTCDCQSCYYMSDNQCKRKKLFFFQSSFFLYTRSALKALPYNVMTCNAVFLYIYIPVFATAAMTCLSSNIHIDSSLQPCNSTQIPHKSFIEIPYFFPHTFNRLPFCYSY